MSLVPAVTAILWAGGAGGAPAIIALPVVADFPSLHEFLHFMRDQGLAVALRRVLSADFVAKVGGPPSAQLSNPTGAPLESMLRGGSIF
jgi:hypothetical protein